MCGAQTLGVWQTKCVFIFFAMLHFPNSLSTMSLDVRQDWQYVLHITVVTHSRTFKFPWGCRSGETEASTALSPYGYIRSSEESVGGTRHPHCFTEGSGGADANMPSLIGASEGLSSQWTLIGGKKEGEKTHTKTAQANYFCICHHCTVSCNRPVRRSCPKQSKNINTSIWHHEQQGTNSHTGKQDKCLDSIFFFLHMIINSSIL